MRKRTQFIVLEGDKQKRKEFYEYIMKTYKLKKYYPFFKRRFVDSNFPFVVDFGDNSFWVCESVTCCACAAGQHVMISIDEFKRTMIERKDLDKKKRK